MSRYRKIDVRIHNDQAFRALSKPQPNGQSLFLFCLVGPFTTNIPGLFSAGEAAMAERLGWSLEGFREAFREASGEAFEKGCRKALVQADWEAHLVWIPNAIKYNIPESPNVIKGWRDAWDELPECELKTQAYQRFQAFLEAFSKAFAKAFEEACPKPSGKASRKPSPNQEQEQEQEHRKSTPGRAPQRRSVSRSGPTWEAYRTAYHARYGIDPVRNHKTNSLLYQVVAKLGEHEAPHVAAFYLTREKAVYLSSRHAPDLLSRDAEGLRTEWKMGLTDTPRAKSVAELLA